MAPSDIVLVPGYWEGPGVWRLVGPELEKNGFNVTTIKLLSTGTPASESPKSPSMVRFFKLCVKPVLRCSLTLDAAFSFVAVR